LPTQLLPLVQLEELQVGAPQTWVDGMHPWPAQHWEPAWQSAPALHEQALPTHCSLALQTVLQPPQCDASAARLAQTALAVPWPQQVSSAGLHRSMAALVPQLHLLSAQISPLAHA
jgi:hypothetical protein